MKEIIFWALTIIFVNGEEIMVSKNENVRLITFQECVELADYIEIVYQEYVQETFCEINS